jgi:hypothetical protein
MSNLPSLTFPVSFINDAASPIQRLIVEIVNNSKAVTVNNDCLWNDFSKNKSFLEKFREKNVRSNVPEILSNLLSEIDTNYDDTNIVAYRDNEAWTFSFSSRFRSLSILKSAVLYDEPIIAVAPVEVVVAPVEVVAAVEVVVSPVEVVVAPVEVVVSPVEVVVAPVEPVSQVEVVATAEPVVPVEVVATAEPVVPVEVVATAEPVVPVEVVATAETVVPVEVVAESSQSQ